MTKKEQIQNKIDELNNELQTLANDLSELKRVQRAKFKIFVDAFVETISIEEFADILSDINEDTVASVAHKIAEAAMRNFNDIAMMYEHEMTHKHMDTDAESNNTPLVPSIDEVETSENEIKTDEISSIVTEISDNTINIATSEDTISAEIDIPVTEEINSESSIPSSEDTISTNKISDEDSLLVDDDGILEDLAIDTENNETIES